MMSDDSSGLSTSGGFSRQFRQKNNKQKQNKTQL